jgi:hypothetical protein
MAGDIKAHSYQIRTRVVICTLQLAVRLRIGLQSLYPVLASPRSHLNTIRDGEDPIGDSNQLSQSQ